MGCSRAKSLGESKREKKVIEREREREGAGERGSGFPNRQRSNSGKKESYPKERGYTVPFFEILINAVSPLSVSEEAISLASGSLYRLM